MRSKWLTTWPQDCHGLPRRDDFEPWKPSDTQPRKAPEPSENGCEKKTRFWKSSKMELFNRTFWLEPLEPLRSVILPRYSESYDYLFDFFKLVSCRKSGCTSSTRPYLKVIRVKLLRLLRSWPRPCLVWARLARQESTKALATLPSTMVKKKKNAFRNEYSRLFQQSVSLIAFWTWLSELFHPPTRERRWWTCAWPRPLVNTKPSRWRLAPMNDLSQSCRPRESKPEGLQLPSTFRDELEEVGSRPVPVRTKNPKLPWHQNYLGWSSSWWFSSSFCFISIIFSGLCIQCLNQRVWLPTALNLLRLKSFWTCHHCHPQRPSGVKSQGKVQFGVWLHPFCQPAHHYRCETSAVLQEVNKCLSNMEDLSHHQITILLLIVESLLRRQDFKVILGSDQFKQRLVEIKDSSPDPILALKTEKVQVIMERLTVWPAISNVSKRLIDRDVFVFLNLDQFNAV